MRQIPFSPLNRRKSLKIIDLIKFFRDCRAKIVTLFNRSFLGFFARKMERNKKMSQIFIDFRPAELRCSATNTVVVFYAKNPDTGKLERQRMKINHIHDKRERMKYGRLLVSQINTRLYEGWNPIVEKAGFSKLVSVSEAIELYRKSYSKDIRPDSLRSYESQMKSFQRHCEERGLAAKPLCQFAKAEAQIYMLSIDGQGVAAKTYNNYMRFMGQFFNFCIDKGLARENPFLAIKLKRVDAKKRTVIPPEVRSRIMDYLVKEGMEGFRLICLLTYHCLIRPKELLMLKVSNINLKDGIIGIPANVAKNHCERQIAIPGNLVPLMERQVEGASPDLYAFSKDYRPGKRLMNTRDTGRTWAHMRQALGFADCYQFYSLKDTGITEMLEAGVPAKMVQELADHHSLEMTQKYVGKSKSKDIMDRCGIISF